MNGSACTCLLILSLLILPPGLHGQADRADHTSGAAPDFARNPFRTVQPPNLRPTPPWPHPPATSPGGFGLPQLSKAAGMIFAARVTSIARRPAVGGQALETVAITFHIEHAIRGASPGEDVTITQWIGVWSSGQRYRIGDRALLFLYPPSKLGLTSCVGWPMGRFGLDPQGRVLLSAQQLSAFRQDPVLGGKSRVAFRDFALAVRQASEEE